jgi:hypothetical protein
MHVIFLVRTYHLALVDIYSEVVDVHYNSEWRCELPFFLPSESVVVLSQFLPCIYHRSAWERVLIRSPVDSVIHPLALHCHKRCDDVSTLVGDAEGMIDLHQRAMGEFRLPVSIREVW